MYGYNPLIDHNLNYVSMIIVSTFQKGLESKTIFDWKPLFSTDGHT